MRENIYDEKRWNIFDWGKIKSVTQHKLTDNIKEQTVGLILHCFMTFISCSVSVSNQIDSRP